MGTDIYKFMSTGNIVYKRSTEVDTNATSNILRIESLLLTFISSNAIDLSTITKNKTI
jgi:hypothetical protein